MRCFETLTGLHFPLWKKIFKKKFGKKQNVSGENFVWFFGHEIRGKMYTMKKSFGYSDKNKMSEAEKNQKK